MARELSVWNRIMYGRSRVPSPVLAHVDLEKSEGGCDKGEPYFQDPSPKQESDLQVFVRLGKLVNLVLGFALGMWLYFQLSPSGHPTTLIVSQLTNSTSRYGGFVDTGSYNSLSGGAKEVLSVAYPLRPDEKYGKPVHLEVLVDHVFDSWGHPDLVSFKPPKKNFTNVVLTLKTTVDGVQYDRLAHLYVGGAEIWRTSTIEPGSREVFSKFKKDVSSYASLFKENTHVLFQLDNVVTGWLTGKFHVELTADFYDSPHGATEDIESSADLLTEKYKVFDIRKPADKVYPLVDKQLASSPPIEYLPSQTFVFKLPLVARNTTRLKLAAFVSGNSDEEFWYSNVLDRYTDRFADDGNLFLGHGPTRFLNVYVDGKKIAAQAPQPFIFTGGYSPALWNPVVAINAFDLPSVDIDVTGLLPLLWESGDHELRLSIDNGLDEVQGGASGIGHDWIVSANLLTYENSDVVKSSGEVLHVGERSRGNSLGVSPPYTGTLQQIVDGIFQGQLTSKLVFELKDGNTVDTTVSTFTKGEISNVQQYSNLGNLARIVHVGHSSKSFLLTDNLDDDSVIHQTNISLSYPLVISLVQTLAEGGVDLDFKIVNSKLTTLDINGKEVMAETIAQNGTSVFHIRLNGNYGSGALTTKLKAQIRGPREEFKYKRKVESADGEVLKDVEKYEEIDEKDWKKFAHEIEQMSNVFGCKNSRKAKVGVKHGKPKSSKHDGERKEHHKSHHGDSEVHGKHHHASKVHGKHHNGLHLADVSRKVEGSHKSSGVTGWMLSIIRIPQRAISFLLSGAGCGHK